MKRQRRRVLGTLSVAVASLLLLSSCGGSSGGATAVNQATCDALMSKAPAPPAATAGAAPSAGTSPAAPPSTAPGGGTAGGNQKKTITFVGGGYTSTTQTYWENLARKFEAANPGYTVNVRIIDWNDIDQEVATMVQTKQYPDILNENKFSGWAANGLLRPAGQLVSPSVEQDFITPFKNASVYDGTQDALPFIASTRALFYNKAAFAKAKITSPPTTWRQLVTDAEKLKAAGYIGYGLPLGSEESQAEWSIWMWGNGGNWESAPGKFTLNSPQNVKTLTFLNCLTNVYKVTEPNPGQTNRTDGVFHPFADGKIGMIAGASFLPSLLKGWNSTVDWGVAPLPVNGNIQPTTLGVEDYLMAFKNPGNTTAVSKFLNFFYEPQNYLDFLTSQGFLPTTNSGKAALANNPTFAPFLNLLPTARFYPSTDPQFPAVQGAVQSQIGTGVEPGANIKSILDEINDAGQ